MALRIELSPEAAEELSESFDWYLERSEAAAEGFLAEVDHALWVISESPEIWPEFEARTRRYLMDRYPFSIIFSVREESVFIHALAHQSRKPGYWRSS